MVGFRTDAAREIASDEAKGGRSIVAAQLNLACQELDRMRERDEILRSELKEIRSECTALAAFAACLSSSLARLHRGLGENVEKTLPFLLRDACGKGLAETPEALGQYLTHNFVAALSDFTRLACDMAKRAEPGFPIQERLDAIIAATAPADLGCGCAKCILKRSKDNLSPGGSK